MTHISAEHDYQYKNAIQTGNLKTETSALTVNPNWIDKKWHKLCWQKQLSAQNSVMLSDISSEAVLRHQ